jgi:glycosyltransferase involved in cell wall biosynthesis
MTTQICFVGLHNLPLLAPEFADGRAGGAELQQTLLAKALARRGWSVSMVVADLGQPDGACWHGVTTYRAYRPRAGVRVLRFLHPRWTRLWGAMRRADADVYYTSCAGAIVGQAAAFTRWHRRKLVFRIASNTDCDPKELLVTYPHEEWLYRIGLARADVVLAQTTAQEQALLRNFERASRVVPPLLDLAGRTRRSYPDRDIDVLWLGNLRPLKRPELLLEAARALPHLTFHLAGGPMPGSESFYDEVQRRASQLGNVTFHGLVPYEQTKRLYERSRVLAATSEVEGFPNTYLQAWAHGVPVVAFLDPEQFIERYGLGRIVQNAADLPHALEHLARAADAWAIVSERCTRFIDERFDEERMLAPYLDVIEER